MFMSLLLNAKRELKKSVSMLQLNLVPALRIISHIGDGGDQLSVGLEAQLGPI